MKVIKSAGQWFEDRTGVVGLVKPALEHPVPPTTGWDYALGSTVLVTFIVQVVTGIALSTSYVSSTQDAYKSLQFISNQALFGNFLRGLHYWGASAMVLFIGLHLIQTFIIGSYKFPREMNWLTGAGLLLFTLAMAFTGQLLRWDQTAFWSVIVAAEQAGRTPILGPQIARFLLAGDTVGGATLTRFFAFHVFFIPAIIFLFLGSHLLLVLRNGISEPPKIGRVVDPRTYRDWYHKMLEKHGVPFWPDAAWRDVVVGVAVLVGIVVLALVFGPPQLGAPPDPTNLQAYPRPDWYLLWYFSVLALIPPSTEPIVIIFGPLLFGVLLVLLPFFANKGERHPLRRPWAIGIVLLAVLIISTLWIAGETSPWSPLLTAQPLSSQVVGSTNETITTGAKLFNSKGCQYCHAISGSGGARGPSLTEVGSRLNEQQITIRILNGGNNMPAYGSILKPEEVNALVAFLKSRTSQQAQGGK